LAGPAAAKVEFEVRLDAPMPRDAVAGSILDIGFTVTSPYDPAAPLLGMPVFIRLQPRSAGAEATEAIALESGAGSGHYVARTRVPAGGIGAVEAGLRSEMCTAGDGCSHTDFLLAIVGEAMTSVGRSCASRTRSVPI
jgi:hypothetical protein